MGRADQPIDVTLRPFAARAVRVSFVAAAAVSLTLVGLAAELASLAGVRNLVALVAGAVAAILVSAAVAVRQRPTTRDVARHLDHCGRLQNLIVSAMDCAGDGMPALIRDAARRALTSMAPAHAYPLVLPRQWRRLAVAVAIVQVLTLAVVWRAPARRALEPALSTLALPSGGAAGAAGAASTPTPASAPDRSTTPAASVLTLPAAATARVGQPSPTDIATSATATTTAAETGANDHLRLAASHATADLAAGRVPASKRTLVARYFAAIQTTRKPPR